MSPNCVEPSFTMATHIISLPPSSPKKPTCTIYQTTNPIIPPEPQKIISIAYMERAVLTVEAKRAIPLLSFEEAPSWLSSWKSVIQRLRQKGHATIQGAARLQLNDKYDLTQPGIWMCGSYSYEGIPLLEGCVVSAKAVVREGVMRSEGIIGG
ncbi:hypothetical protein FRC03_012848 [Tulasnella sp. 419]|nr:hypothetical protein FRC03_012848 [Tulasnella sp. 419]